jgi:hypothetical protein
MTTKLYIVTGTDENGGDITAVVEATDPNDAVNQWHTWLSQFSGYSLREPTPSRRVFEIPEKLGVSRPIHWNVAGGVIEHEI